MKNIKHRIVFTFLKSQMIHPHILPKRNLLSFK